MFLLVYLFITIFFIINYSDYIIITLKSKKTISAAELRSVVHRAQSIVKKSMIEIVYISPHSIQ